MRCMSTEPTIPRHPTNPVRIMIARLKLISNAALARALTCRSTSSP
jgi:hypothetical protein